MGHFFAFLNRLPFNLRVSRGTSILVGVMVTCSLLAAWGMFTHWLILSQHTIPRLELTALLTNTFVEGGGPLRYIFVLAIGGFFLQDKLRWMWQRQRNDLITFGSLLLIVPLAISLLFDPIWGLASSVVLFMWFIPHLESRWGLRKFLTFITIITVTTNLVGAILLWLWPIEFPPVSGGFLTVVEVTPTSFGAMEALLGSSHVFPTGSQPLINAMLTVWALSLGRGGKLAILNIEPYKLVYVIAALAGLEAIFSGFASGMMSLAAIGVAWMLVRGVYNPKLIIDRIRLFFIERRLEKRRQGFKVVQGGKDGGPKGPTLH